MDSSNITESERKAKDSGNLLIRIVVLLCIMMGIMIWITVINGILIGLPAAITWFMIILASAASVIGIVLGFVVLTNRIEIISPPSETTP